MISLPAAETQTSPQRAVYSLRGRLCSKAKILSQIEFPCDGALGDGLAVALDEEFALAEKVDAVDDVKRLADVMVGDEDAHTALAQILDDLLDVGDGKRIDARERLVEQNELRFERKAARDLHAAAFAAREFGTAPVAYMSDMELLKESVEAVFLLGLGEFRRLEDRCDVL